MAIWDVELGPKGVGVTNIHFKIFMSYEKSKKRVSVAMGLGPMGLGVDGVQGGLHMRIHPPLTKIVLISISFSFLSSLVLNPHEIGTRHLKQSLKQK